VALLRERTIAPARIDQGVHTIEEKGKGLGKIETLTALILL